MSVCAVPPSHSLGEFRKLCNHRDFSFLPQVAGVVTGFIFWNLAKNSSKNFLYVKYGEQQGF